MLSSLSKTLVQSGTKLSRGLVAASQRNKHTLPDLPYDYNALEPVVSAEIMQLHHQKHHATYVNNLNVAEEKLLEAQSKNDVSSIITLGSVIKFNGGGHINHSIFWKCLTPNGTSEPTGDLADAIKRDFGSYDKMIQQLSTASVGVQGSGWGWLAYDKPGNRLQIVACPNQDPLLATTGLHPLFGIDVWEHAYYLQYKNVRAEYVKNIFKIANWRQVEENLKNATK